MNIILNNDQVRFLKAAIRHYKSTLHPNELDTMDLAFELLKTLNEDKNDDYVT